MNAITLDLVTPEKLVSSEPVEMVVIPGKEGDFGVLNGHAPMISSLRPGVLRVFEGDKVVKRLLLTGGFAEVTAERCTVMATEAFDFADTDVSHIKERHEAAKRAHEKAQDQGEKAALASEAELAQAIVDAFIQEKDA